MVDALLDFMLGPMRGISQFYFEYQLLFNSIVVGIAAYFLIKNKKNSTKESNN
ncbi:hypothetical protein ACFQ4N_02225 [Oceanobacillus iheyensis]|uniref:hypothetical protein n=1 Tax=Oceanobacillus iheyensis TaxID=182710 RepID=UPI0002DEE297|nr:hypothetical protein [Oceanobacillus iheyensis]